MSIGEHQIAGPLRAPGRLSWGGEARAMAALALPIVGTQLAVMAMMTTDVVLLGHYSPNALAAGALGSNVYFVFWIFCMGVAFAGAPLMAQAIGRKRHAVREVRRSLRQSWWVTLVISIPCIAVLMFAETILLAIDQPAEIVKESAAYIRIMCIGFVPSLWIICLRNFISALERPLASLAVTSVSVVLNGLIGYVLIFGHLGFPAMGVVGAGVATATCSLFGFMMLLSFTQIDRQFRRYHILGRFWRPDWRRFREILRIGAPIGFAMVFEIALFGGSALLMGWLGPTELAASQIALQIASITFMVPMGIGQAATVRVGLAIGAGDARAARRAGWVALGMGLAFMTTASCVMWLAPRTIVAAYLGDSGDSERVAVAALAISYVTIAAVFQIFDGAQGIALGILRGLKDTRVPMLFAGLGYWGVGLPLGVLLAFPLGWRGQGVWWAFVVALVIMAVLMVGRFLRLTSKAT